MIAKRSALRAIALAATIVSGGGQTMAYEQPEYRVVTQTEDYEIREYEPYLVAETTVAGSLRRSGSVAFRRLAGYIFGNNGANIKMNMTAPVQTRGTGRAGSLLQVDEGDDGSFVYAFVMERKFAMDALPAPDDPAVTLRAVDGVTMAVRRFSGRWTDKNYRDNERALFDALTRDGINRDGAPMLARYDGPLTPWFLRHNEVLVPIQTPTKPVGVQ